MKKKDKSKLIPILMILLGLAIIIIVLLLIFNKNKVSDTKYGKAVNINSSLVSLGVKEDDLGNIVNGQYYFDDGTNQYYSNFDKSGNPHVYVRNNNTNVVKTIFDGFGWSFTVNEGWLYFSGNSGNKIDGTYTLYRIKTDGTNLEHIINKYTVNMNFYKQWLYYIRKPDYNSSLSSIYRSSLDGTNEEEIVSGVSSSGLSVVFDNKLYYIDSSNYMYRANPDGTLKEKIIVEKILFFVIGKGKIIYLDENNNIKSCTTKGEDTKTIRPSSGIKINKINSYEDTILYITYDENFNNSMYAWKYNINTINMDGTNDKKVYEAYSYGFYVNILNNKIYVLDYVYDSTFSKMVEITRNMNINGSNLQDLYR